MKFTVLYILGLFANRQDPLFKYLRSQIEQQGARCEAIELYDGEKFGSYLITKELERIQRAFTELKPQMIIAHSLGAYITMQIHTNSPIILLEPSLSINDIILPNIKNDGGSYVYDDGLHKVSLGREFVKSLRKLPPIKTPLCPKTGDVYIFGAGKGGHRVAEQYHNSIFNSHYFFLPNADHNFSNRQERLKIMDVIKKRLDVIQLSR